MVLLLLLATSLIGASSSAGCPEAVEANGFYESADSVYNQVVDQLIGGRPIYQSEEGYCLSYDQATDGWWLHDTCPSQEAVAESLAWLPGDNDCPDTCSDQDSCQEWRIPDTDDTLPDAAITAADWSPLVEPQDDLQKQESEDYDELMTDNDYYAGCQMQVLDVGRGKGSCNDDCDCPDCAPFCSNSTRLCRKTEEEGGSIPCNNYECYTNDDCYIDPKLFEALKKPKGCHRYEMVCRPDHTCAYVKARVCFGMDTRAASCVIPEGAVGRDCARRLEKCNALRGNNRPLVDLAEETVCGVGFSRPKSLSPIIGVSIQEKVKSRSAKQAGRAGGARCPAHQCKTRAGSCCSPVQVRVGKDKKNCPFVCQAPAS